MLKTKSNFLDDIQTAFDGTDSQVSNEAKIRMLFQIIKLEAQDDTLEGQEIWQNALNALVFLNQAELIIPFLNDENADKRQAAAIALGKIGNKGLVSPLLQSLNDKNSAVKMSVMEALAELGDKAVIPHVSQILKSSSEDSDTRYIAAETLMRLGGNSAKQALEWLLVPTNFTPCDYWSELTVTNARDFLAGNYRPFKDS
jgi:HEAT repeat protein